MGIIATTDDLIKVTEGLGDMAHNTSDKLQNFFAKLGLTIYQNHEYRIWSKSWELHSYPNNRRRFRGEPLVRIRSHQKAYRNERRRK